jgi:ABC-type sugar transport system permease subunit
MAAPTLLTGNLKAHPHTLRRAQARAGAAFVAPAILFLVAFAFLPMLIALVISLTDYNLLNSPNFVGFHNYQALLDDPRFVTSLWNTLVFAFGSLAPTLLISLTLAAAFAHGFRGANTLRTLYFLPMVFSLVIVAIVWRALYNPIGPLNAAIGSFLGRSSALPLTWLTDPVLAPLALIAANVWQTYGLYMLILLAGLQAIPEEYYDAAKVDGAGTWQRFRSITLPLLRPQILFVTVISLISSVQAFTYQYLMTRGGPSDSTNVIGLYIYQTAFLFQKMGYASAMSVILFVGIMILTGIQFRILKGGTNVD